MNVVHFDKLTHTYTTDGGIVLPSVTTVIKFVGLSDSTYYTDEARQRGSDAHDAIAAFLTGDADTFPAHIAAYVSQVKRYLNGGKVEPLFCEEPLEDRARRFAGTPDIIARFVQSKRLGIIDVKAGARERWHEVQVEAYAQLVQIALGEPVLHRVLLYVTDETHRAIDVPPTSWPYNARVWESALCLYHERTGGDDTWRATKVS